MTAHREQIAAVLREHGLTDRPDEYDGDIHSWRCRYPDRYGPCDCFAELLTDLAGVLPEATETEGFEITVAAFGLDLAARDALFDRVADAAHALDEEVTCVGALTPEGGESDGR